MKKLLIAIMMAVVAVTVGVSNVEAKRLGGGSSVGKQSQSASRQAPVQSSQASNAAAKPAPQAIPPKPASPWKGILGGALLGLGLGALLSHFGLGGAMASMLSTILMVALLAMAGMFIYRMFRRRKAADSGMQPVYGGAAPGYAPEIGSGIGSTQPAMRQAVPFASGAEPVGSAAWSVPADFDVPGFLRHAKTYFIRLQAAWDKADLNDIREFATPEMFAEVTMQIQERGTSSNNTDVVSLDAELLGIETLDNTYLASVKFSGMIKESDNAPAAPFTEIWNLSKPQSGQGGWVLAGIQQSS